MKSTKTTTIVIVSALLLIIAFGFSYNFSLGAHSTSENIISGKKIAYVGTDRKTYNSIGELKKDSDVVVVGVIRKQLESHNLNRLAKDNPDAMLVIGTDFEFEVQKYIKGEGDNLIVVTQEGGELNGEIQILEDRPPMEIGQRYILFLKKTDTGKHQFGGTPYKFKLTNGIAKVDAGPHFEVEGFKDKPEKSLIEEIKIAN